MNGLKSRSGKEIDTLFVTTETNTGTVVQVRYKCSFASNIIFKSLPFVLLLFKLINIQMPIHPLYSTVLDFKYVMFDLRDIALVVTTMTL